MFLTYFEYIHGVCEVKYNRFCVQKSLQYTVKSCFDTFFVHVFFLRYVRGSGYSPREPQNTKHPGNERFRVRLKNPENLSS